MIKAIVFDLDNTLVDFMAMKRQAIEAAIDAMLDAGLDLERTEIKSRIDAIYKERGIEYQQVFDDLIFGVFNKVDHRILAAGVIAYRRAREAALKPYPHVTATLMQLIRRGIALAVLTDAPSREAWLRLCHIGFHHIFNLAVTFDDTQERKPSAKPFLKVLELLNTQPGEALMVGDWAERDIVGAKAVGMRTAFARYGDVLGTQVHGADYDLHDINELLDIVDRENK
ncbi:MAG TPA: HAD-IA family hydrolase [Candidatus Kapabacteria bacterium]|jgi:putative hydrolase of the HAD superfamily|nr:HAD-IA family hydrolase [Candidatus Kapabacteria bacterium]